MPRYGGRALGVEAQGFKDAMDALKLADPALQRALVRRIRVMGDVAAQDTRNAILTTPSKGGDRQGRGSLRVELARAVMVSVRSSKSRSGVQIKVSRNKLSDKRSGLARPSDGVRPWKHPVFFRVPRIYTEVSQQGHPWFLRVIFHHQDDLRAAVAHAVDDALRQVRLR